MASQDAWARPLADQLVDLFRVNSCNYIRRAQLGYDPSTGDVGITETVYPGAAAVTKLMQANEEGGTSDTRMFECWINMSGIDDIYPTTLDEMEYEGARWKIVSIDPAYAGDTRYAVKITARAS